MPNLDGAYFCSLYMAQLEIFALLQTLHPADHLAFEAYWLHPARQDKKLAHSLYTWLQAHPADWHDQSSPAQNKALFDRLYPALYPGEAFKPQRVRRLLMELKEVLLDFLAQHARPQIDPHLDRELRLLQYLLSRDADRLFLDRLADLERHLDTLAPLAPETFLARFWMEEKRNEYLIQHQQPRDTFEALNDALDSFYLSRKLENFSAMRARDRSHPQPHAYALEDQLLAMLAQPGVRDQELLRLWQAVYQMQRGMGVDAAFAEARDVLATLQHRLPAITLRQVHGYLFNHLVAMPDTDNRAYYQRLWDLLRQMLDAGTLHMPDGRMTPPFFLQTVRTACLARQPAWAADFVAQVKADLFKDSAEELLGYAELLIAYYGGAATKAWRGSLTFRPKDLRLEAYARILQVQLAFALDKEEEFERMVDSLEKFIRRATALGPRFVELVLEFARLAGRIGHARFGGGKLPQALVRQVRSRDAAEKLWLIAQVEALE